MTGSATHPRRPIAGPRRSAPPTGDQLLVKYFRHGRAHLISLKVNFTHGIYSLFGLLDEPDDEGHRDDVVAEPETAAFGEGRIWAPCLSLLF